MHVEITPKEFIKNHLDGRLTFFQDTVVSALESCKVVVIPDSPTGSGLGVTLYGYLAWELLYSPQKVEIDILSRSVAASNGNLKQFFYAGMGSMRRITNKGTLWTNEYTRSTLDISALHRIQPGRYPSDVYAYVDIDCREDFENAAEHLHRLVAMHGKRYYRMDGPKYGYDANDVIPNQPIEYEMEKRRFIITGRVAHYLRRELLTLGYDEDEIAILTFNEVRDERVGRLNKLIDQPHQYNPLNIQNYFNLPYP